MRALDDAEVLALWERAAALHPLDRALVLCGAARDDVAADRLADLPLGEVNVALLRLRREHFGRRLAALVECERCGGRLEIALDAEALLAALDGRRTDAAPAISELQLRAPTIRDLAAVAAECDAEAAARALAERCGAARDPEAMPLDEVERCLDALDPAADIALAVTCDACGHAWHASLDIGAFLWTEMAARAATVLGDVHRLASAYGWSEREILALGAHRRAAYLELCGG
jgi:hypothetical protein